MELEQAGKILSGKELEKHEFYQTLEKIENKDFLEQCLKSEEWSVWRKVWKDTRDYAQLQLNQIDPKDTLGIMRLQMAIDFYDNVLKRSIETYRTLGKEALGIARENGWLDRLATYLRKD